MGKFCKNTESLKESVAIELFRKEVKESGLVNTAKAIGLPKNRLWNMLARKNVNLIEFLRAVLRLRKVLNLSWSRYGALLEKELFEDKKK